MPVSFAGHFCAASATGTHCSTPQSLSHSVSQVDAEVQKLLGLKEQLKGMSVEEEEGRGKLVLKPPKGMRDFGCHQMEIRERVLNQIVTCFKKHGAQAIDTPVCEMKAILTGKYGEDSKLIFDLADQGEHCFVRQ